MKFHIFQSQKGDCILLESNDGRLILCDGGMAESMRKHVRNDLSALRAKKRKLDYVYVSHIDQDHISGVLQLLQDELEWRVYDFHRKSGGGVKKPEVPRPPAIGGIWHNSFRTQIGKNAGPVADLLAAAAPALLATRIPKYAEAGEEMYQIATSIPEAIKVSHLVSPDILNIPLNKLPGSKGPAPLLRIRKNSKPIKVGSMKLRIVGPTEDELSELRDGWNNWLRDNKDEIKKIEKQLKKKVEDFSNSSTPTPIDFGDWNGIPNYKGVTAPNIASLMLMVEEDGKRALLTGDSQQDIILKGLKETGYLDKGYLHLDVFKMPHHASEHNFDVNIASVVTADNYVFCGNGQHGNPDPRVIDMIFDARIGQSSTATAPESQGRKFTFWFSTEGDGKADAHMKKLKAKLAGLISKSNGRMKVVFNKKSSVTLNV